MCKSCKNQGCRDPRGCQDAVRCVLTESCHYLAGADQQRALEAKVVEAAMAWEIGARGYRLDENAGALRDAVDALRAFREKP